MSAAEIREALRCGRPDCACAHPTSRVTHCPVHGDRRPSFSVDDDGGRVLVICRAGCGQADVIEALRGRGLWSAASTTVSHRSPEDDARRRVLARERYRLKRLAPWFERYREADEDRWCAQVVIRARQVATALGDTPESWDLLDSAARLERLILNADA